jgi:SAM-dependent methyltransferase
MPDPDWWQALWPRPGDVLGTLDIAPDAEVVDLCCGDGLFTIPLARSARHVTAIDLDPAMLALARDRACADGLTNCAFVAGDAYDVATLVQARVDWVLIANTFHGVPDKTRLVSTVATVLKPGGRLVVINWHRRPREQTVVLGQPRGPGTALRMAPEEVAVAVRPTGLRAIRTIELPPFHYASVFEKPPRA